MIIKEAENNEAVWTSHPVIQFIRARRKNTLVLAFIFIISLVATSLWSIYYGMHLYKVKAADSFAAFFENAIQTKWSIVPNFINGRLFANPERITIDIKHTDFQRLAYKREIALATGILMASDADFVSAQIRYGDKPVDVKIRLKGDWVDHLLGDKWSFRIVTKGENSLFGMKQFSIHHPKARNYVYEWIFH